MTQRSLFVSVVPMALFLCKVFDIEIVLAANQRGLII